VPVEKSNPAEKSNLPENPVPDGVIVELTVCNDGVNAAATAYNAAGKEIELPARIEIQPQFLSPASPVAVSRCRVRIREGEEYYDQSHGILRVSGMNGKAMVDQVKAQLLPRFVTARRKDPAEPGPAVPSSLVD
jgi:hypothetical protein